MNLAALLIRYLKLMGMPICLGVSVISPPNTWAMSWGLSRLP
jgi:hypothetical protein